MFQKAKGFEDYSWFEVAGKENWLVRLPGMRAIHKLMYPDHPDYNGGDY